MTTLSKKEMNLYKKLIKDCPEFCDLFLFIREKWLNEYEDLEKEYMLKNIMHYCENDY